jgi:hypothetical protein
MGAEGGISVLGIDYDSLQVSLNSYGFGKTKFL